MKTKLKDIREWLESNGLEYIYDDEEKAIVLPMRDRDSTQLHIVRIDKKSEMLQWHMQMIKDSNEDNDGVTRISLNENKYKDKILQYILYLNYQYKIGSWEYDYHDGDIRFYVGVPLNSNYLTKEQFERVLAVMLKYGNKGAKGIAYISEYGEFPEERSDEDMVRRLMQDYEDMNKSA